MMASIVFLIFLMSIQCACVGRNMLIHVVDAGKSLLIYVVGAGREFDKGVKSKKVCWFHCCLYPHCPPPPAHIASTTPNPSAKSIIP